MVVVVREQRQRALHVCFTGRRSRRVGDQAWCFRRCRWKRKPWGSGKLGLAKPTRVGICSRPSNQVIELLCWRLEGQIGVDTFFAAKKILLRTYFSFSWMRRIFFCAHQKYFSLAKKLVGELRMIRRKKSWKFIGEEAYLRNIESCAVASLFSRTLTRVGNRSRSGGSAKLLAGRIYEVGDMKTHFFHIPLPKKLLGEASSSHETCKITLL